MNKPFGTTAPSAGGATGNDRPEVGARGPDPVWTEVLPAFGFHDRPSSAQPCGNGHINDTYVVTFENGGRPLRYLFQRINHQVFRDVPSLMENIERVTTHCREQEADGVAAKRRSLTLVRTGEDRSCWRDAAGRWWRCYIFIERATSHEVIVHPGQAREAARAFGRFQRSLTNLPGPRLHETIVDFHHTRRRFEKLRQAIANDAHGRLAEVSADIAFALEREPMADRLLVLQARGDIPERITHNDTKLANVMLDDATGQGVCVIDLDTVMPGLALHDLGDMVRTAANSAAEDETDLNKVKVSLPIFSALVEGFMSSAGDFLNPVERRELVFAGRLLTYEQGIRFLTDYLEGDVYYKTKRPGHNRDRARNQFALLHQLEHQASAMEAIAAGHFPS